MKRRLLQEPTGGSPTLASKGPCVVVASNEAENNPFPTRPSRPMPVQIYYCKVTYISFLYMYSLIHSQL